MLKRRFLSSTLALVAVAALAGAASAQGTFTVVDGESVPGPGDNMVVVERGRAQYVVTISTTGDLAYSHRVESDGQLTAVSTAATGSGPRAIAMARHGDYAIIVNSNDDDMSVMSISNDGVLSEVGRHPTGGDNPFDVDIAFDDLVVVANRDSDAVTLFGINRRGDMQQIGQAHPAGVDPHVIAIGPSGVVAVANSTSNDLTIFDLDRDGNMELVNQAFAVGASPKAVTFGTFGRSMFVGTRPGGGAQDRIEAYEIRRPNRDPEFTHVGTTECGHFLTDLEATPDKLLAATVNGSTGKNEIRAYDRRRAELTPAATQELPGAPSFQTVSSAPVRGPVDRVVFVSQFQASALLSLEYED